LDLTAGRIDHFSAVGNPLVRLRKIELIVTVDEPTGNQHPQPDQAKKETL
jgi:hypothetical protein